MHFVFFVCFLLLLSNFVVVIKTNNNKIDKFSASIAQNSTKKNLPFAKHSAKSLEAHEQKKPNWVKNINKQTKHCFGDDNYGFKLVFFFFL